MNNGVILWNKHWMEPYHDRAGLYWLYIPIKLYVFCTISNVRDIRKSMLNALNNIMYEKYGKDFEINEQSMYIGSKPLTASVNTAEKLPDILNYAYILLRKK